MVSLIEHCDSWLRKHWTVLAVILIVLLSFHIRLIDYRWPYLRNIDSYAFYREMEMIVDTGMLQTTDTLFFRSALEQQIADAVKFDFNPLWYFRAPYQYLGAFSFMLVRSIINIELWQYLIYLPALLASLAAIPAYYVGREIYDRKAGVLAALFYVFDISNVSRSLGGDPDTDSIIMLFPVATMALYLLMYRRTEVLGKISKLSIIYGILAGVMLALFQNVWAGYWYLPWLIAGFLLARSALAVVQGRNVSHVPKAMGRHFLAFGIMMAAYLAFNAPFFGVEHVYSTIYGPFEYSDLKSENIRPFPNVYVSVAELQQPGNIVSIIGKISPVGGAALWFSPFMLSLYALAWLAYAYYKRREHFDTLALLSLWLLGPMIATLVAVRFTLLFAAPMSVGGAILLSRLYDYFTERGKK